MIRTESEYEEARRALEQNRAVEAQLRAQLAAASLVEREIDRALAPIVSKSVQLDDEIAWFRAARDGKFPQISRLTDLGRCLVGLRIAYGMTQRELAAKLGTSESAVSRDERNEYHGISIERAQKIIDALEATVSSSITARVRQRQMAGAGSH
jgi:DNA-binding XRE family transcriptional regulator